MSEFVVRQYQPSDREAVVRLIEDLQDYLVEIDPLRRLRRQPGFGRAYVRGLLRTLRRFRGVIFLAQSGDEICGLIAGAVEDHGSRAALLEQVPSTVGRVLELVVDEGARRRGTGCLLMEKMENYFHQAGCDISRIDVFAYNEPARSFYERLGYAERNIEVVKELKRRELDDGRG